MIYSTSARVRGAVEEAQARRRARPGVAVGRRQASAAAAAGRRDRAQPRLRRRAGGRRRLPPPRRAPPRRRRLDRERPGLDQRRARQRSRCPRQPTRCVREIASSWARRRSFSTLCMTTLAPVSVALKFGFLAVLYLFLLWVARSALRDLRGARPCLSSPAAPLSAPDATGLHSASAAGVAELAGRAPRLVVERAPGHDPGMIYDLDARRRARPRRSCGDPAR